MTRIVFARYHLSRDGRVSAVHFFDSLAAAKHSPYWDTRIALGKTRWRGDERCSTLNDDVLGDVVEVRRLNVRSTP